MKTKLHYYLIFCISMAFAAQKTNAQQLIQFWDFNQTRPWTAAGGGDSLGTQISYVSLLNDTTLYTPIIWPLYANYVQTALAPGHIVYSRPNHKVGGATKRDSIIDNGNGGAFYYDYSANPTYFHGSDTNALGGNYYIRTRNPSDSCFMYLYIPTNGFKNISLQYAISASSSKGALYNVFSYSTNGISGPWNPLTAGMDTFNTHSVNHYDTLVMVNSVTTNSGWYPVQITFTSVPAVNNNPNFILRMLETGTNSTGTSGNDRYDNFAVLGSCNISASASSSPTSPCTATGTATVTPAGGNAAYTYAWITSPVQTSAIATGLSAGTYTVNVTDASSCSTTASVAVTALAPVSANPSVLTNAGECSATGKATAAPAGGNSPYTYSWNSVPPQLIQTSTGLSAGTYTVTVKDINGCAGTASVTITAPPLIIATATVTANATGCNANGIAGVHVVNGLAPYTYSWTTSPVQTNVSATGLSAGAYTVTVTDNSSCSASSSISITAPPVVTATATITAYPTACSNIGSANSSASGGTLPYTYSWSSVPVQTNATATGLSGGTYTITVTDNNRCAGAASVVITQASALTVNLTPTNISCNGNNNGKILSTPGGGTLPYTYLWTNSYISANENNLSTGTYTLTVTDHSGCTISASATITQPNALTVAWNQTSAPTCNGNTNGTTKALAIGGTPTITYKWNDINTTTGATLTAGAGNYIVTATDANGCTVSVSATITQPTLVSAQVGNLGNVTCFGGNNGTASVSATGGILPYTYSWSPGGQTTATASGLTAFGYVVTVTDKNGCLATGSADISQPPMFSAVGSPLSAITCNGDNDGSASSSVTGGTQPYTYSWTGGETNSAVSGLTAGSYTLNVTDNNGCTESTSVTMNQPAVLVVTNHITPDSTITACNGTAKVTVSGGTSPYTYSWAPGNATADSITNACGEYCCTVWDSKGCVEESCVRVTTGIETISNSPSVTIYPNPTSGHFTIEWVGTQNFVSAQWSVEVYNILGERVISQTNIHNSTFGINIGNQANGIYFVRILNGDGSLAIQRKIEKMQ